jgi:hypothetical protein
LNYPLPLGEGEGEGNWSGNGCALTSILSQRERKEAKRRQCCDKGHEASHGFGYFILFNFVLFVVRAEFSLATKQGEIHER